MHDIYDPPPAPVAWNPPKAEPLVFTTGDLVCLVVALRPALRRVVWRLADRADHGA